MPRAGYPGSVEEPQPPESEQPESPPAPAAEEPLAPRLHRALGPMAVGIILDLLDLGTFGIVGIYAGAVIGLVAGWYLGMMAGLGRRARVLFGIAAAAYLTLPMTEFLPLATLIAACGRFLPRGLKAPPAN